MKVRTASPAAAKRRIRRAPPRLSATAQRMAPKSTSTRNSPRALVLAPLTASRPSPSFEAQKANFPMPRIDMARVYVQQTFGLGGEQETIDDGPNQIAGTKDISRITVIAGRFAVTDFFDNNAYAHDGRTQFFNWNIDCCGSYDWTMDQISYTWGAMAELNQKFWAVRGRLLPGSRRIKLRRFRHEFSGRRIYRRTRTALFTVLTAGQIAAHGMGEPRQYGQLCRGLAEPITTPNYPDITLVRQVRDQLRLRRQSRAGDHCRSRRVLARNLEPGSR